MTAANDQAVVKKVREHENDLRDLAASDLHCAKYAKELLALADDNGGGH